VVKSAARALAVQIGSSLLTSAAAGSLVFGAAGCVAAPPGPRGPLRGEPGAEVAIDYSFAVSSAEAELEGPPGAEPSPIRVSGSSDHYWAPYTVFPPRAELRLAALPWFDVGGHLGWLDGGVEIRVGLPAAASRLWAVNLAGGIRSGELGPFEDTKEQRAAFARLEAYPLVYRESGRLVLALGLDAGTFYHQINYVDERDHGDGLGFTAVEALRDELRLEGAVGYHWLHPHASILAAVEPYVILDSGEARAPCSGCEDPRLRQSFGVVVLARFAWFIPFARRRAAH
jgi:hypothetical protein